MHAYVRRQQPGHPPQRLALHHRPDRLGQVEMGHLAPGVDAGVGPAGHRQGRPLGHPQRHGEGLLEDSLDRTSTGLRRPAEEVRAVIGEIEADSHDGIEPAAPCGVGGLGCVGHEADRGQALASSSSAWSAPGAAKPAASAASSVANHTSAMVWSYQRDSGVWNSIESALPLMG